MNITYFLIALGFVSFCMYMMYYAVANYRNARDSNSWISVGGTLTEATLWGKRKIDGRMVDCENLNIKFTYEVNGRKYDGAKISFYTLHYPETTNFLQSYTVGSRIPVYYNPQNPSESVVVPGLHPQKPASEIWLAAIGFMVASSVCVGIVLGEIK